VQLLENDWPECGEFAWTLRQHVLHNLAGTHNIYVVQPPIARMLSSAGALIHPWESQLGFNVHGPSHIHSALADDLRLDVPEQLHHVAMAATDGFASTKIAFAESIELASTSRHDSTTSLSTARPIATDVSSMLSDSFRHGPAKQSTYQSVRGCPRAVDPSLYPHFVRYSRSTSCFSQVCSRPVYSGGTRFPSPCIVYFLYCTCAQCSTCLAMSDHSAIEWTDATWNPVLGCTKISPGCKHCYAETFSERFRGVPNHPFERGFDLRLVPKALQRPFHWRRGRLVFVNSMSDLFHEEVPAEYIQRVFEVMTACPQHRFQVLTKRADRLASVAPSLPWPKNVWMGVSVEARDYIPRIHRLREVPAAVRFLSLEPLLGPLGNLPLKGIDWVIVGGESGRTPRPMKAAWVRTIQRQCARANVPFFFKQWGGRNKKAAGRELDGREWNELPTRSDRQRHLPLIG